MKILVTGASGLIGSAVSTALARAGHRIRALAHSDAAAGAAARAGHEVVRGDLAAPATVAAATAGVDAVVWTATTNDGEVDAAAIAAATDALAGSGRAFVYTSGIWIHGDTRGSVQDESSPVHPVAIAGWRPAVEQAIVETAGIRPVIIRPGLVYGGGGGLPAMFVTWARQDGAGRVLGSGDNVIPCVHVADLADLYVRVVERPVRGVYLAIGCEATLHAIAEAASKAAGRGGAVRNWTLEQARAELGGLADALALDQHLSAAKALSALDWRPEQPDILADLENGSYRS